MGYVIFLWEPWVSNYSSCPTQNLGRVLDGGLEVSFSDDFVSQSLGLRFYLAVSQSLEVIIILHLLNWANICKNVAVLHAVE